MSTTTTTELIPINQEVSLEIVIQQPPNPIGLAIIGHPYSRLGGNFNDPIVTLLSDTLSSSSYPLRVIRFNSRGVGKSTGTSSWTGCFESIDFQQLVEILYNRFLPSFLFIIGYSASALYASTVRIPSCPKMVGYILLAYPIGVRWFLSFFQSNRYSNQKISSIVNQDENKVLVIYGTKDQFSSESTYDDWVDSIVETCNNGSDLFQFVKMNGADHFYRTREHRKVLMDTILHWIQRNFVVTIPQSS